MEPLLDRSAARVAGAMLFSICMLLAPVAGAVDVADDAPGNEDAAAVEPVPAAASSEPPPAAAATAEPAEPAEPSPEGPAPSLWDAEPASPQPEPGAEEAGDAASAGAQAAEEAGPSTEEAEAVWQAYEERWAETEDYSAGFRQVIEVPDIGSRVESAGRFYFAKPGLVRWEYVEGPPQTVVGDGTWIWLYQPDLEQVYKIPYAQAFGRGGLVELLAGRDGVSERYTATLRKPDDDTVIIELHSRAEAGGDLELTLDAGTFDIREVAAHDRAGSTTRMTFAEPRRNHGIDPIRFAFTPPPAVDIISDGDTAF